MVGTESPPSTPPPAAPAVEPPKEEDDDGILTGAKLGIFFAALMLSLSLTSLDQTIISTALPTIASEFDAFSKQGWISAAFLLAQTCVLLPFGQIIKIFPVKYCLLSGIFTFEVGSIVAATAQSANTLIGGRAITGVGAGMVYLAIQQSLVQVTKLQTRAKLLGWFGVVFGVFSVVGPLLGGAFTQHVTWRWVFWINLPIGGLSFLAVLVIHKAKPPLGSDPSDDRSAPALLKRAARLDWVGAVGIMGFVTSLSLALQWGGNTKPWNSGAVIACFVVAGVLAVALVVWSRWMGDKAMTPPVLFKSISIYCITAYSFCSRFSLFLFIYYIPIYFQAGKNESATSSGLSILPFMISFVICAVLAAQIVGRQGRYWPWLVVGPIPFAIGSGLMFTISEESSKAKNYGYQVLIGVGIGVTAQNAQFAMQAEFKKEKNASGPPLLSQAMSLNTFGQYIGATIGLAVSQAVFASQLASNLATYAPSAPAAVVADSPTAIYTSLDPALVPGVVKAYCKALDPVFVTGVPLAGLMLLSSLFIKNIDISKKKGGAEKRDVEKSKPEAEAGQRKEGGSQ
ncbi:Major facilitator transporter-like protein [Pseudohyphozyma bogoriensis]|nr:Major facilitator transporter-like protein [Pseudohyphozyma bogoriensis]